MKHTTSRMLFAYWDGLRGDAAAPERADVRPGGLRHVLADSFILATGGPEGASFRLAGTRICALFGRDMKGGAFGDMWPLLRRREGLDLIEAVTDDAVGIVAGLIAANENESELPLELVLLPLLHRGRSASRILGALSPASVPPWAGLVPLRSIETRSVRVIQPSAERARSDDEPGFAAKPRHPFTVHDGGRT